MTCPDCYTKLLCVDSRPFGDIQQRRYVCKRCNKTHNTHEIFAPKIYKQRGPKPPKGTK